MYIDYNLDGTSGEEVDDLEGVKLEDILKKLNDMTPIQRAEMDMGGARADMESGVGSATPVKDYEDFNLGEQTRYERNFGEALLSDVAPVTGDIKASEYVMNKGEEAQDKFNQGDYLGAAGATLEQELNALSLIPAVGKGFAVAAKAAAPIVAGGAALGRLMTGGGDVIQRFGQSGAVAGMTPKGVDTKIAENLDAARRGDIPPPVIGGDKTPALMDDLLARGLYKPKNAKDTQITSTFTSYLKMADTDMPPPSPEFKVLDFGGGMGLGSTVLKERGYNVDMYEPFFDDSRVERLIPEKYRTYPTFRKIEQVPKNSYDRVILNANLNVTPLKERTQILTDAYDSLKEGGLLLANTMGLKNIEPTFKGGTHVGPNEVLTSKNTFQKGHTMPEYMKFLDDNLPEDAIIYNRTNEYGELGVVIQKPFSDGRETTMHLKNPPIKVEPKAFGFEGNPELAAKVKEAAKLGAGMPEKKFGVGKAMGKELYMHMDYARDLPDFEKAKATLEAAKAKLTPEQLAEIGGFEPNLVRYNTSDGTYMFTHSPDFDKVDEPTVGWTWKVDRFERADPEPKFEKQIYHHKWQWVKPDYQGFDYEKAVDRSITWQKVANEMAVDDPKLRKSIGSRDKWNGSVVAELERRGIPSVIPEPTAEEPIKRSKKK